MRKIVIATDSFKGSLSSSEVALAVEDGVRAVFPESEVVRVPVADGGEGILDALSHAWQCTYRTVEVHDPLMRLVEARYGVSRDGRTAVIEMAQASGLPLVPVRRRNPWITTTLGTGEMIKDALLRGCRDLIVGVGGSATNDAGLGMLQALGFRFRDKSGKELGFGGRILEKVASVDCTSVLPELKEARFTAACDVDNPFYGAEGAACVFAPQKGADPVMVKRLDAGLRSLAAVILSETGKDVARMPGAGAAGGMGGALSAFLDAELMSGIRLLLNALDFEKKIVNADLIITGEGKIDRQTLQGKVPCGVLEAVREHRIPVIAIAGQVEDRGPLMKAGFTDIRAVTPSGTPLKQATNPEYARQNIRKAVIHLLKEYSG